MLEPEGALGTIVEQLDRGGSAAAREHAVVLLRKIAEHTDALNRAIGRNPVAIKTLAKFVSPGAAKVMPRAEAATTLAALARGQRANQDAIAAAGALSSLVKMLKADAKEGLGAVGAQLAMESESSRVVEHVNASVRSVQRAFGVLADTVEDEVGNLRAADAQQ